MRSVQPVSVPERVPFLDALRGFALFGILLGNIPYLSHAAEPATSVDKIARLGLHFFVDGKFYSLFSLLFGIGFAIQLSRHGHEVIPRFARRLAILFGIGMIHLCFIWMGDILAFYALIGFLLIPLRHFSNRTLLILIVGLFIAPVIQYAVMVTVAQSQIAAQVSVARNRAPASPRATATAPQDDQSTPNVTDNAPDPRRPPPGETLGQRVVRSLVGRSMFLLFEGREFKVLATFLLGFLIWRCGLLTDPVALRPTILRVFRWGLLVGVIGNFGMTWVQSTESYWELRPLGVLQTFFYAFGVPMLALGYASGLFLLWNRPEWSDLLKWFSPAGRMALTNYVSQSLICKFLFSTWFFGSTFGNDGPRLSIALVIAAIIYLCQIIVSAVWLQYFTYGPLEWVWRCLTYQRWFPIGRNSDEPDVATDQNAGERDGGDALA